MITFKDMVLLFKRAWWKIGLVSAAVAVVVGVAGVFLLGKTYTAEAVLFCNVEKKEYGNSAAIVVDDPTPKIIGRCQTVMQSGDYLDKIIRELKGNKDLVNAAKVKTDGSLGSITVTVTSKKKGSAKSTAELFVGETMIKYMAEKVGDTNTTVTIENFELVSTPSENEGERSMSIIALTIGSFIAAFVIVYLVWLAVVDYKMQSEAEKKNADSPEEQTPAAE